MSFRTALTQPEVFAAKLGVVVPPLAPKYHKVLRAPSGKLYYLLPKPNEPGAVYKKYLTPSQTKRCIDGKLAMHKGGVCRAKRSVPKKAAAKAAVTRRTNEAILRSAKQVKAQRRRRKRRQQEDVQPR